MKRKPFHLSLIVLLLLSSASLAGEHSTGAKRPSIDLFDLMSLYMIPDSGSSGEPSWWIGAQPDSAIEWHTTGIEWDKELRAYVRLGEAMVTINGTPVYQLKKYVEPVPWKIRLVGRHHSVHRLDTSYPTTCDIDFEEELRKKAKSVQLYRCDPEGLASMGEKIYRIKFPDKKPAWLYFAWSSGTGGLSGDFTLFLYKEDAEAVPNLVMNCKD
jgi:hypothetical protein